MLMCSNIAIKVTIYTLDAVELNESIGQTIVSDVEYRSCKVSSIDRVDAASWPELPLSSSSAGVAEILSGKP